MEIKSDSEVFEEITEEYNRDPEGNWRVTAFRDEKGRYDLYVVKGKRFWQVKTEFITPHKSIGVGGKTTTREREPHFAFGLRTLPKRYIKKIVENARNGEISEQLLTEIMKIPPVSTTEFSEDDQILQGPVTFSPLHEVSPSQRALNRKLASELDRLLFREQVGSMYR
jgi:hypothetical protein